MKLAAFTLSCTLALGLIGCADSSEPANAANFTPVNTATAQVDGMTCSACEGTVCSIIKGLDGVKDVTADAKTGQVKIALEDGAALDAEAVRQAVNSGSKGTYTVGTIELPTADAPETGEQTEDATEGSATKADADADATFFVAEYQVDGMSCAACSGAVSTALSKLDGVQSCDADFSTGKVHVKVAEGEELDADQVAQAVKAAGFTLVR